MRFKERDEVDPFFYDPDSEQEYLAQGSLEERYEIYVENTDDSPVLTFDEWLDN